LLASLPDRIEQLAGRVDSDASFLHVLVLRPDRERTGKSEGDRRPVIRIALRHAPLGLLAVGLVGLGRLPVDRHDAERREE